MSWAAECQEEESYVAMGYLLELTWDIDSRDETGRTALSYAAANMHYEAEKLVQRLLEAGADPDCKDNLGKTPLLYAVENFSEYTHAKVHTLLQAGADPNIQDNRGRTPIFAASNHKQGGSVWDVLEAGGANIHIRDAEGRRPYCCWEFLHDGNDYIREGPL